MRPDPLRKPSSPGDRINLNSDYPQRTRDGVVHSSPLLYIIINITNIAIISAIITNSITKDEVDFRPCNTKQKIKTSITMNSSSGGCRRPSLPSPRSSGSSTSTWCTGEGPSKQGSEVPMKVLNQKDHLKCCQRHGLSPSQFDHFLSLSFKFSRGIKGDVKSSTL